MNHRLLPCLFSVFLLAACAAESTDEEDAAATDDALTNEPSVVAAGKAPVVMGIDTSTPRLRAMLEQDWSQAQVDVRTVNLNREAWVEAKKVDTPTFDVHYDPDPEREDDTKDLKCRYKIGPKKFIVDCRVKF